MNDSQTREREIYEIFPLLYDELRKLAAHRMAGEFAGQTLQATALVHEAYLRLASSGDQSWKSKSYFFAAAAEAMRRILIDRARARLAARRGGGLERVDLSDVEIVGVVADDDQLLALDAAVKKLSTIDSERAELVKLKFFAGLTNEELANVFGVSEATLKRSWALTRAWLARELTRDQSQFPAGSAPNKPH